MSQIMQIAKEKTPSILPTLKMDDAKNASLFSVENNATDMMGLSWVILDYPQLHLVQNKRGCNETG